MSSILTVISAWFPLVPDPVPVPGRPELDPVFDEVAGWTDDHPPPGGGPDAEPGG